MHQRISVIIPNLNSPTIAYTLNALHAQTIDLSQVEVLVVGLDRPGNIKEDHLVRFVNTGKPTSAAHNRNLGIKEAKGDILCFTDSDCVPSIDWLVRLTAPLLSGQVSVLGGGVAFNTDNYWSACDNLSWFYKFLATADPGERDHLPTLNLGLHRQVVAQAGYMNENFPLPAGEDTEWTMRMRDHGYRLFFEPRAIVTHVERRTTFKSMLRHAFHYGRFSPKVSKNKSGIDLSKPRSSLVFRHLWLLFLAAPLIASLAAVRSISHAQIPSKWKFFPGVWVSKLAWCFGAMQSGLSSWKE